MIRVAIIEDVPIARQRLRRLLENHVDVQVVAEAADLQSARSILAVARADLVFLDVSLPDGEGPDLFRALPRGRRPLVIFSTARADHALPAFEIEAIDYLLKPISGSDVNRALERARSRLASSRSADKEERLAVSSSTGTDFLPIRNVEAIIAQDHYLLLFTDQGERLTRGRISDMETKLASHGFIRVHRSAIVRIASIRTLRSLRSGDAQIHLNSGRTVRASRSFMAAVRSALKD